MEILLLVRAKTDGVDLFKLTSSLKMIGRDLRFAERTANTMAGLQQAQRQAGRSS